MKRHYVQHCDTCGRRRWVFSGWLEIGSLRDDDLSLSFCSQGHPIIFRSGAINRILREAYLPSISEALNSYNPLSRILRS